MTAIIRNTGWFGEMLRTVRFFNTRAKRANPPVPVPHWTDYLRATR